MIISIRVDHLQFADIETMEIVSKDLKDLFKQLKKNLIYMSILKYPLVIDMNITFMMILSLMMNLY